MAKEKKMQGVKMHVADENVTKKFDSAYAIVAIVAVILFLCIATGIHYKNTFAMLYPEQVAEQYCTNEVIGKDDFNSLKYSTLITNQYLGDYFRNNYVKPVIQADYEAKERTPEEEGNLKTEISKVMDAYYAEIIAGNTDKTLDSVLSLYMQEYAKQHEAIFSEPASSEDEAVECFEASVQAYSEANSLQAETLSAQVTKTYSDDELETYKSTISESRKAQLESFGIALSDIAGVCEVTCRYSVDGQNFEQPYTLVQVGSQWYVDIAA